MGGRKGSTRQPYFFHRPDDGLILFAGLWQWYQDQQGYSQTFAIVTTAANALMAPIHDRMPAILDEGDSLSLWLNPTAELKDLRGLLRPAPDDLLEMRPVSPLVNSVKNDGPGAGRLARAQREPPEPILSYRAQHRFRSQPAQ